MSDPFIGEIRPFGFNFAPRGWATCSGQLLSIAENNALFALIGTIYGGDGRVTFGLPDLRGRVPIGFGSGPGLSTHQIGAIGGSEERTLTTLNLPSHTHTFQMTATAEDGDVSAPAPNRHIAAHSGGFSAEPADTTLSTPPIGASGGNLPFPIMQPSTVLSYCIALEGIFPSRS